MRGLSEYRIRAADSISPPLALEGAAGSVFWMLAPWNLWGGWLGGARALWILDSGNWAVGGSTGVGARPRILDSGFWELGCRRGDGGVGRPDSAFCILYSAGVCAEGEGPPGFWILETGNWAVGGSRGVGPPAHSVFWILETGLSEGRRGCGPPGFCILHSVFCRRHMHVLHMHGGRDVT